MIQKFLFAILAVYFIPFLSYSQDTGPGTDLTIITHIGDPYRPSGCHFSYNYLNGHPIFNVSSFIAFTNVNVVNNPNLPDDQQDSYFLKVSVATTSGNNILQITKLNYIPVPPPVPANYLKVGLASIQPTPNNLPRPYQLTFGSLQFQVSQNIGTPQNINIIFDIYLKKNGVETLVHQLVRTFCVFNPNDPNDPNDPIDPIGSNDEGPNLPRIGKTSSVDISFDPNSNKVLLKNDLNEDQLANLDLLSVNGQLVKSIWNNHRISKGSNQTKIQLPQLSPGLYFIRFTSAQENKVFKIMVR